MKVSFWKALSIVGLVADELTKAGADNRITIEEALGMVARLAPAVGIKFDDTGSEFVLAVIERLLNAASDGKITIREAVVFIEDVCGLLGIDFDKEGIILG